MAGRVVVGFDGSHKGRAAVTRAITLAKRQTGGEVVVVCTHDRPADFSKTPLLLGRVNEARWFRDWAHQTHRDLEQEVSRIRLAGVEASSTCGYADPADLLQKTADEVGADLIVVPDDRAGLLHDLILGSVAKRLIDSSPIPVVPVKDER